MGWKYSDCQPNATTVIFTIAAWYMDIDTHTTSYEVLDYTHKRSLALMDLA